MFNPKSSVWQTISLILIAIVFILVVIAYFFVYQYQTQGKFTLFPDKEQELITPMAGLTKSEEFAKSNVQEDLSFEEDLARFLKVYFDQEFSSGDKKQEFIKLEYSRFASYPTKGEQEKQLLKEFINHLGKMVSKADAPDYDFEKEESELFALYQRLN